MRGLIVAEIFFISAQLAVAQDGTPWKEYSSAQAGFSILFPGSPVEKTIDSKDDGKTRTYHLVGVARKKQGETTYLVQYFDRGKLFADETAERLYLGGVVTGALGNAKGKLLTQKQLSLGKARGVEFSYESPAQGAVRTRVYSVGEKVYNASVFAPSKDALTSPTVNKFFESFRLVDRP